MSSRSLLARLSFATTAFTFVLAAAGGLVRATNSGLGCPGWPKCYGRWIPPADHHAIIEMTHRYLASAVSIGVIATCAVAILFHRRDRVAVGLGVALVPVVLAQALLGAYVVHRELEAWTVVAHLGLAMAFAAVTIALTVHLRTDPVRARRPGSIRLGLAALAVYAQLLLGSYVSGRGAGLVFRDFPLHGGRLIPAGLDRALPALQFTHRLWAYAVVAVLGYALLDTRRRYGRSATTTKLAHAAAGLVGLQIVLGALNIWTRLNPAVVTAHLSVATLIFGSTWAAFLTSRREPVVEGSEAVSETETVPRTALPIREKVTAYVALTKPRIIELLLVTTVPTMVVAQQGMPSIWLMIATVVGGTFAAGGANALNMYVDRDIDALMKRTANRPLVTGAASPRGALVFATVLEIAAFLELWLVVNLLSAVLAIGATAFYVLVYTIWLKRRSSSNIVIGGAAGAVPVLIGWSAVTGKVEAAPLVLFLIIFVWTPPHFWALAIKYREDYAAADVPMLPVVASLRRTARQIVFYTVLLWAATLVFSPVGHMGGIYDAAALVLGAAFLVLAIRLWRELTVKASMQLFSYSITYVTLLFGAMALDRLVLG
jgi:protoheme IX farnesyltransferase